MRLITIDPGLRGCGCAMFDDGVLVAAAYVQNPEKAGRGPPAHYTMASSVLEWAWKATGGYSADEVIVEFPRIYPIARQKGDQNDLLDVAGVASAVATLLTEQVTRRTVPLYVEPRTWKGTVPKDVMTQRIRFHLSPTELGCVIGSGAKDHNTFDAIGIGLHHVGRL